MRRLRILAAPLLVLTVASCGVVGGGNPQATGDEGSAGSAKRTRTVKHAMGTSKVPVDPRRVVTLDSGETDAAVTLGVQPVGTVRMAEDQGVPGYLADELKDAKVVGTILEPNLETIASLNPDLILSNTVRHKDIYDELSGIAPTVMAGEIGQTWKKNFMLYAEALGMKDKAERMLTDYEQRAKRLGERIGKPGKLDVSVVRFLPGEIRIYRNDSYIGTVLADVGLGRPAAQDGPGLRRVISPERISMAGGDVIFVTTWGPKKKTQLNSVTDSELWRRLDAVRHGDVHFVPDSYWMVGLGLGSANRVLDDLENYLVT